MQYQRRVEYLGITSLISPSFKYICATDFVEMMFTVSPGRYVSMRRYGKVYTLIASVACFMLMQLQHRFVPKLSVNPVTLNSKNKLFPKETSKNESFQKTILSEDSKRFMINMDGNISNSYQKVKIASHLTLIIVVCSHPEHVQQRQTIRSTWGHEVIDIYGVQVVFLLGLSSDESWREITKREIELHGDIVQVDVAENYRNLAHKVLTGMKWVSQNAPHAGYYMKCDDDVYINLPYLLHELSSGLISSNQILGALSPSAAVIRDPRDEWSVPYDVFPAKTFPPYVAGGCYVMSMSALTRVLHVRPSLPELHLEDVYITGILAQKARLSHVHHGGFSFWSSPKAKACDIISNKVIASVNMSANYILKLHRQISELLSRPFRPCSNTSST